MITPSETTVGGPGGGSKSAQGFDSLVLRRFPLCSTDGSRESPRIWEGKGEGPVEQKEEVDIAGDTRHEKVDQKEEREQREQQKEGQAEE